MKNQKAYGDHGQNTSPIGYEEQGRGQQNPRPSSPRNESRPPRHNIVPRIHDFSFTTPSRIFLSCSLSLSSTSSFLSSHQPTHNDEERNASEGEPASVWSGSRVRRACLSLSLSLSLLPTARSHAPSSTHRSPTVLEWSGGGLGPQVVRPPHPPTPRDACRVQRS